LTIVIPSRPQSGINVLNWYPAYPGLRPTYTALHNKVKYYFAVRKIP